jgi:hypothetical protein
MKSVLVLFSAFLLTAVSYGQSSGWTLYSTVDGIEFYTAEADCNTSNVPSQKAIIVKVVNPTADHVSVEWDHAIWYNGTLAASNTGNGENHFKIDLEQNSEQEGSCDKPYGAFYIFKDFILYDAPTKMTKFEIQNIVVTRL